MHHVVHPVSGTIVLTAAGVEVFEWMHATVERLARLVEALPG